VKRIKQELFKEHPGTDTATYIRGGAALAVVLIHWDGLGLRSIFIENSNLDLIIERVVDLGALAPIAFFIASGFALACSLSQRKYSMAEFIFRRYFRLAPLLCFVLLLYIVVSDASTISVGNFLAKITFIDVVIPKYFYDDPLGILWSVPIEFWWSLSVPYLYSIIRGKYGQNFKVIIFEVLILISLGALAIAGNGLWSMFPYTENFPSHFILSYGFYFVLGALIYQFNPKFSLKRNQKLFVSISGFLFISLYMHYSKISDLYLIVIIVSALLLTRSDQLSYNYFKLIGLYLGNICYSLYLFHQLVYQVSLKLSFGVFQEAFAFTLLLTISTLGFLLVELPFIKLGKKLYLKISPLSYFH